MSSYAKGTDVPIWRSRVELERLLLAHKATHVSVGFAPGRAVVTFGMNERLVRFIMPLATADDFRKVRKPRGRRRSASDASEDRGAHLNDAERDRAATQRQREQWRALVLAIKAKLVSVEQGVESFEVAFLAHVVVPDGSSVAEHALPAIAEAYRTGGMPPLLPPGAFEGGGQ